MKNNLFVDEEGMDIILYYNIVTESDKKDLYCAKDFKQKLAYCAKDFKQKLVKRFV